MAEAELGKPMREGYTTGASAAAAMKAAILALRGEFPKFVTILSPQGAEITIPVDSASAAEGIGTATVLKDGGDDLDCTHGTPVVAEVRLTAGEGLSLKAGNGVGIVT